MGAMFLIVRDEDVPTVTAAINAYASEEGLDPANDVEPNNPLALLATLSRPRAFVSMSDDSVLVSGLESLDIAEADEWANRISTACSAEVIALDVAEDGVRVFVFDDGEKENEIEVALGSTGRSTSGLRELAELAFGDEERQALEEGLIASSTDELADGILRCFGVESSGEDGVILSFSDPIDDQATLQVEPVPGAILTGTVGSEIQSPFGYAFAVSLVGGAAVEGCRLELGGDALPLISVDAIDVSVRARDTDDRGTRRVVPEITSDGRFVAVLDDALLERVDMAVPSFDVTDMFASMQRLMSSTEAQQRNLLLVGISARGLRVGSGDLVLTVSATAGEAAAGEGAVSVKIA
jgi:hypothetical protein